MKNQFQGFVDGAVKLLKADSRLRGLAIGGSWITGELDEFSDLDLVVVSCDEDYPQVLRDRLRIAKSLGDMVSSFTGEHVGEPGLVICLFKNPLLHVDLQFVALKDFGDRIENPWIAWERGAQLTEIINKSPVRPIRPDSQWIEDRFWTWIHYGAAKLARGEYFEVISTLNFLREVVLGPLAMDYHGKLPRGVRRIEKQLPEFASRLQETVASCDYQSCLIALQRTAQLYKDLRSSINHKGLKFRTEAETESLTYLDRVKRLN